MKHNIFRNLKRFNSNVCQSRFYPLNENYKILRHVHYPDQLSFQKGQDIQERFVQTNLEFKKIASKIRKQQTEIRTQGYELSDYEKELLSKILDMRPYPTLLTFEFENVYTGGKRVRKNKNIDQMLKEYEKMGCPFYQLERGGEVTWHGKGQLVAYLILDIKEFKNLTVRCYVDSVLLKAAQNTLSNFKVEAVMNENPGLWVEPGQNKIVSVGCHVQRAITSYGVALNVDPDLTYLNKFIMCGLPDARATSISAINPSMNVSINDVASVYAKEIAKCLNISTIERVNGKELEIS